MIEIKRIHYEPEVNVIECGIEKDKIKYFTNDKDTVTCKMCKELMKE